MSSRASAGASAALSSISSAGIVLISPLVLSATEFGILSISVMVAMFGAVALNHLVGEVLLSLGPVEARRHLASADRAAILTAATVGAVAGLAWLTLRLLDQDGAADIAAVVAVALPCILLLTYRRTALFAIGESRRAAALDVMWLVGWIGSVATVYLLVPSSRVGAISAGAAWALPALLAYAICPRDVQDATTVGRGGAFAWFRRWGRLGKDLSVGELLYSLALNTAVIAIAAAVGVVQAGGLRLTQTAYGMGRVVFNASRMYLIPRLAAHGSVQVLTLARVSVLLTLVPLLSMAVLAMLLNAGSGLVDDVLIATARQCVLPVGIASVMAALLQGPLMGLRVLQAGRAVLTFRLVGALALVILPLTVLAMGGRLVEGAWALATAESLTTAAAWVALLRRARADRP